MQIILGQNQSTKTYDFVYSYVQQTWGEIIHVFNYYDK